VRRRMLSILPTIFGGDGSLHLTHGRTVFRGAFNHNWDPYWSSSLFGSYSAGPFMTETAKAQFCAVYTPGKAVSADFRLQPGLQRRDGPAWSTRWTPVKNLTFSAEVLGFFLDQRFAGSATLAVSGSQADHRLRVQGPERCQLERFAFSATSDA